MKKGPLHITTTLFHFVVGCLHVAKFFHQTINNLAHGLKRIRAANVSRECSPVFLPRRGNLGAGSCSLPLSFSIIQNFIHCFSPFVFVVPVVAGWNTDTGEKGNAPKRSGQA
jgi:hypothetical protein